MSSKVKGILSILFAIGLAVGLVIGWDFLAEYTITLRFLDTPLIGARLFFALGALASLLYGLNYLGIIHWLDDDEEEPAS